MMNARGKSDRPIVPTKLPNKAVEPATEAVEGRGLAKGNLPEGDAFRTQGRGDALSALERVRQAQSASWRHHPRWEPDAVAPLVRICGGGRG